MKHIFLSALSAGIFLTALCKASEPEPALPSDSTAHACNGCSYSQASSLATSLGRGDHYVYDLPDNHLYLFEVECEPGASGTVCYANSLPPDSSMASNFSTYHNDWTQNSYNEAFSYTMNYNWSTGQPAGAHDDGYVNAYDSITTSVYTNQLTSYLRNGANYSGYMSTLISVLNNSTIADFANLTFVVTVVFHDGSKRKFEYVKNHDQFEPIENTAIDSDGNTLPETHQSPRTYLFHENPYRPYNPTNIAYLLDSEPPDLHVQYYRCDFDGVTLTCEQVP